MRMWSQNVVKIVSFGRHRHEQTVQTRSRNRATTLSDPVTKLSKYTVTARHETEQLHCQTRSRNRTTTLSDPVTKQSKYSVRPGHETEQLHCQTRSRNRAITLSDPVTKQGNYTVRPGHETEQLHCHSFRTVLIVLCLNLELRHEKTYLRSLRPSMTQTGLLS